MLLGVLSVEPLVEVRICDNFEFVIGNVVKGAVQEQKAFQAMAPCRRDLQGESIHINMKY